jgi:hypothetical protein
VAVAFSDGAAPQAAAVTASMKQSQGFMRG